MMDDSTEMKRRKEQETVSRMIRIYCHGRHGVREGLCPQCRDLEEYARKRSACCPFMKTKTFCSNCRVHCYQPEMREKIREVMRYSGWRMLFIDPSQAIRHVCERLREKGGFTKRNDD